MYLCNNDLKKYHRVFFNNNGLHVTFSALTDHTVSCSDVLTNSKLFINYCLIWVYTYAKFVLLNTQIRHDPTIITIYGPHKEMLATGDS